MIVPIYTDENTREPIQVFQQGAKRWLTFGDQAVHQSIINFENKAVLPSQANQAMLACLMFAEQTEQFLLIGVGGGCLARFIDYHLPHSQGDAIEISAAVARVAKKHFEFPDQQSGWNLIVADAKKQIHKLNRRYDVIIIDIEHNGLTPDWLTSQAYLQACKKILSKKGILVISLLLADEAHFKRVYRAIQLMFNNNLYVLSLPDHKNIIAIAFNQSLPSLAITTDVIKQLEDRYQIEFAMFLQRLKDDNGCR